MNIFKDRFKEIRKENGLTHKQVAEELNTYENHISAWERGVKKPSMDNIIALCKLFDITSDYLLGLSDDY